MSLGRQSERYKEIAVRKVNGVLHKAILRYFVAEYALNYLLAFALGCLEYMWLSPVLNSVFNLDILTVIGDMKWIGAILVAFVLEQLWAVYLLAR